MNIAIFHYQVGGTDGVSLEIDKWKLVLEEMGHTVYLCGGDLGTAEDAILIPELYHHREDAERLNYNMLYALRDYASEAEFRAEMYALADQIEQKLRAFIAEKEIDMLIPQNVWSVVASPPVAIAMTRVMQDLRLPAVAHNHDFYWERAVVALTCGTSMEIADLYLPPHDSLAKHVVINSLAQKKLLARKGIESTIVPNIFDFDAPPWSEDDYNRDFRERIGLQENDVMILQATRIVPRKGIELAIDFVAALNQPHRREILRQTGLYDGRPFNEDSRIVLVLAGYAQDDMTGLYLPRLKEKVAQTGIDALFIEDLIASERETRNGEKIYSLWDSYVFADFVTYPSLWEGWGNQLLEALCANLPVMLFEYPVYNADIAAKGFEVVSLGSELSGADENELAQVEPSIIEAAADEAIALLSDTELRRGVVERNFNRAKEHYSMESLRGYLAKLMPTA